MVKRRTAGEGTINQLPSGSWRAQVSLKGKRISYTARDQQAARQWIRKIQAQIEQGLTYDDERTTLGKFLEGWLENKRTQVRASSARAYVRVSRSYIEPRLGSIRLKDLAPGHIQKFYDDLLKSGLRAKSINLVHTVLRMCLEQALQLGLIIRNPAVLCKVPKSPKLEMKIWDENQVNKFLISIRGERNENLYYMALATGMRRGELLGLKWQDVDWAHQRIMVHRQVSNPEGGGFIFTEPKTARGRRSVQLGSEMIERLRDQLTKIDLMRAFSRERWQENDLVFPSHFGKAQICNNLTSEFRSLIEKSGLPQIRLHDCRHTAASILLSRGIPPVIVAEMLGHSVSTLITIYAHFIPGRQDEAAEVMNEVITPIRVDLNHQG